MPLGRLVAVHLHTDSEENIRWSLHGGRPVVDRWTVRMEVNGVYSKIPGWEDFVCPSYTEARHAMEWIEAGLSRSEYRVHEDYDRTD